MICQGQIRILVARRLRDTPVPIPNTIDVYKRQLYRKFRPDNFADVKGQEHIVTTLQNQIKADRVGHAYLFCGTRGTGKTTVAKILAKAVNLSLIHI